nr:CHASE2 domain-containing protein [Fischerella sp. FACHB-380]
MLYQTCHGTSVQWLVVNYLLLPTSPLPLIPTPLGEWGPRVPHLPTSPSPHLPNPHSLGGVGAGEFPISPPPHLPISPPPQSPMTKLIVLKLDGDFNQGFRVTLEIGSEGERPETEIIGNLPSATEVALMYSDWQSIYRSLSKATRVIKLKRARIDGSLKKQREECRQQASELCDRLNIWLRAEPFFPIREKWLEKVSTTEEVRLIIRAENYQLWQLPWQEWDLLERYSQVEIGLSTLESEFSPKAEKSPIRNQLKILAILGNSEGIQVEQDRQQLLNLPNAEITFLVEPQRQELNDQLWEQHWDILFFAGHSQTEGEKGRIYLNQTDSLTLNELRYALQKAVTNGLQLAIFNSCDGLGLARELKQLHIPEMIVMREPVPDMVAQAFLKYFLQAFANSKSLYTAVQQARQRLQGLEDEFPCASWLPVICQNPAAKPLIWVGQRRRTNPRSFIWRSLRTVLATSLVVTSLLMGVRSQGFLQKWELASYDYLLRQRPPEEADSRLLIVGADEEDIRKYKYPLPDGILARLITKLEQYQPVAIGLDIFRDQPVLPGHDLLVSQLEQNQHLIIVCTLGNTTKNSIAPPPKSPASQLGFNDLEVDHQSDTIRRQLLSRTSNPTSSLSPCKTPYAFSLQLAGRYLKANKIPVSITVDKDWQFGKVVFRRLQSHSGGYQNLDARGNQILINYRAHSQIARRISIEEILTGKFEPEWINNKVVLIGVSAASVQDNHTTPYGKMRGLDIHAHVVSQILSAVENQRPLIWWLPQWGDALWILAWSVIGGVSVLLVRSQYLRQTESTIHLVVALSITSPCLYWICLRFLIHGYWLPFIPTALALLLTGVVIAYIPLPKPEEV